MNTAQLTLGPVLYNWPVATWRDFYFEIADEAPVTTVFLGEVVCSKRAPLFDDALPDVVARLTKAGKRVVFSTLAQVTTAVDRRLMARIASADNALVEANDTAALWHLDGRPHTIGPTINVYNEETLRVLAHDGACSICLPPEVPASGIAELGKVAAELNVALEVQVYGRMPLALSARCYHARAHDRIKDTCQYVCENDPDGLVLNTLEDRPFLTVNGIQTLSYTCLNLIGDLDGLAEAGVSRFRISPHSAGTITVAETFQAVLDRKLDIAEALARLKACAPDAPFSNGFLHGRAGHVWHA